MHRRLLLLCLSLALVPGAMLGADERTGSTAQQPSAPASTGATSPFEGVFGIGVLGADRTGNANRVGEYDVLGENPLPQLGLQLWGERGSSRFDLEARHSGNSRDQYYFGSANVGRRLKAVVEYSRVPHRLDHDPLTWMDAASNIGGTFLVQHTDTDPGTNYAQTTGEFRARAEYLVPVGAGNLRFMIGHRQQMRTGTHQALTTSHCSSCHTYSFSRSMDQKLRDLTAGAQAQFNALTLDYSFENRRFDERAGTPTTLYDRARHPGTLAEVFLNRVSYDQRNGLLPFDSVPGLRKDTHVLRARVSLPRQGSLTGAFTRSTSTNADRNLDTVFTSTSGRFVMPLGKKLTVRASVRHYAIESDDVFVDVAEPVAPAGPSAGKTYLQAYPALGTPDFTRRSSLNRTPTLAEIEGIYRPFKKTTVRFGYEYDDVRRQDFEVERTQTSILRASARSRIGKTLQTQTRLRFDWTKDPFAYENAAVPGVLQPFQSPGNVPFGTALQYFEMYRSRSVTLSGMPSFTGLVEEVATWTPTSRVSVSGSYRFRSASNDDLTISTWDQTAHAPSVQVWVAPADRWSLAAGYTYQRERTKTLFSTLSFVG